MDSYDEWKEMDRLSKMGQLCNRLKRKEGLQLKGVSKDAVPLTEIELLKSFEGQK